MRTSVTSNEVARLAGVSQATVSRVLSGSDRVAAATRARVESAVTSLGYRPNAAARAMRSQRTDVVGVVVDRITNPFYPQLLDALGRALEEHHLRLILWDASYGDGERMALESLEQRLIDGLLFTTITSPSHDIARAVRGGAPIVLVNRNLRGVNGDLVDTDNAGGSHAVARYLAAHGRRRVAIVGGPLATSTAQEREAGFVAGAREFDLVLPRRHRLSGDFSHAAGDDAVARLLDAPDGLPDAVFCVNDLSAFGFLDGARRRGIRVPDDLWVIGFDNIEMSAWPAYDLTTADQPITAMARASVALLVRRLGDERTAPEHRRMPTRLIVRGSTANAPGAPLDRPRHPTSPTTP